MRKRNQTYEDKYLEHFLRVQITIISGVKEISGVTFLLIGCIVTIEV